MDQPGKLANLAGAQLNRGKCFSPLFPFEFGLARQVWPSRPASARVFSTRKLKMVLTQGIPPDFRDGVHIYRQPPSGQSRLYRVTQLRTNGVHCRESAGTGPVVPKAVRVRDAPFQVSPWAIFYTPLVSRTLILVWSGYIISHRICHEDRKTAYYIILYIFSQSGWIYPSTNLITVQYCASYIFCSRTLNCCFVAACVFINLPVCVRLCVFSLLNCT